MSSEIPPLQSSDFYEVCDDETALVLSARIGECPTIIYWGKKLPNTAPSELALSSLRQWAFGGPSADIAPSLSNEIALGSFAAPGFLAHRDGLDWGARFVVETVEQPAAHQLTVSCADAGLQLAMKYFFEICPNSGVLTVDSAITNRADNLLTLDWCAAACLPIEEGFTRLHDFNGRWAMEFQHKEIERFQGTYLRENRSGRTSHHTFPGLLMSTPSTSEVSGDAIGFHLGWSGNHRTRIDTTPDRRTTLQMGELFLPGEIRLGHNESYLTPTLFVSFSCDGLNGVSKKFHRHVRSRILDGRAAQKPRPIHFNSWEAVYFDHNEEKLLHLAQNAAAVGAERFVIDDGWFGGRRGDRAGLGDWHVSAEVYPSGLDALTNQIRNLGMEVGLWFEPEMVNPDSDLFRTHPDWILEIPNVEQIQSRNQYVLDLTRDDVSSYLFEAMTRIIADLGIDYIKWDMNRDLQHPGSRGRAAVHHQTKSIYALIKRLRDAHENLEIETCSSGGGRADFGIMRYTDRIWTSDSNDAHDRQLIQRGASYFFPPMVLGSHVGPKHCHITHRNLSMEFRAATALFGHMGLEVNLDDETTTDLATLKRAIALHKQHRRLIHSGDVVRLSAPDFLVCFAIVGEHRDEALVSVAKLHSHTTTLPPRLRLAGLDRAARYCLKLIWPEPFFSITTPSIIEAADLREGGSVFSGDALMNHGFQLPLMHPDSALIFYLEKT